MLKREHIKRAIEAISARNPEVGHTLNDMLATGGIDTLPASDPAAALREYAFLFNNEPVHVPVFRYFHEGTTPIEERLLVKYGELVKRQEYLTGPQLFNYRQAADEIRGAGLRFLIEHEVSGALERLARKAPGGGREDRSATRAPGRLKRRSLPDPDLMSRLEAILDPGSGVSLPKDETDPRVLFRGVVDKDTPAYFLRFPYCFDSLRQVADLNLEFFGIRFLLNCLPDGSAETLFCCLVNRKIVGLAQLTPRTGPTGRDLEIRYIATSRGKPSQPGALILKAPKGGGTVLVAGAWMLWKSMAGEAGNLILDSEIDSIRFYESIGFHKRNTYGYGLKSPRGHLLLNILIMTGNLEEAGKGVMRSVGRLIRDQVKLLRKHPQRDRARSRRQTAVRFIELCLDSERGGDLGRTALGLLARYRSQIPEADRLMDRAIAGGLVRIPAGLRKDWHPVLTVFDDRYARHLEHVFHLENAKRAQAMRSILNDTSIRGRWSALSPRLAEAQELALVHTAEHIDFIAATAGRQLFSIDMDTQTTERTYEVARLAAGGVFRLLEEIWSGASPRGFALVRPPGHHAEPGRAMGYCIFNNVALGARYLQEKHGLGRIMVVDIDAHHGNGTQTVFYDTDRVLYFSLHQYPFYPGTGGLGESGQGCGEGFTVNVPLPMGQTDLTFADTINHLVRLVARQYRPEMILVSCGFDLYHRDPSSRMKATPEGYGMMANLLIEIAEEVCRGRIAFIVEGGYSLTGIRECGLRVMQELCGIRTFGPRTMDKVKGLNGRSIPGLKKITGIQKAYWVIQ